MKTMQGVVWLLIAVLLSACAMQGLAERSSPITPTVATPFLCPPGSSPATEWECQQHVSTRTCTPLSSSKSEWACYEDVRYGFALEYPSDWKASMPFDYGSSNGVTIIRRHSFMGAPRGALDVDIWPVSEPDLVKWLEKMSKATSPELFPVMESNAKVGGVSGCSRYR
jgi:hypothetical protein